MRFFKCVVCGFESTNEGLVDQHASLHNNDKKPEDTDAFFMVLSEINTLHKKKKADYASDQDRFSNFKIAAQFSGMKTYQSIENLIGVKQARLLELRGKKEPLNESLRDTLIDRAVYSILAVVLFDEENNERETKS